MSERIRQRLRYPRRNMPARLHRRSGSCQGTRGSSTPHDIRQDGRKIRNLQCRNRLPELLTRFEAVNNLKLPYKIVGRRPGDVPAVWADTAVANEVLGWKAERELDDTLRSAWAWEKHIRNIK
jgi:nucleoside-diphosphate-sugar epimerase